MARKDKVEKKLKAAKAAKANRPLAKEDNQALSRGQKKRNEKKLKVMQKLGKIQPKLRVNLPAKDASNKQENKVNSKYESKPKKVKEASEAMELGEDEDDEDDEDDDEVEMGGIDENALMEMWNSYVSKNSNSNENSSGNQKVITNKQKKSIMLKEAERIKLVQQQKAFQTNPVAALQAILQAQQRQDKK